VIFCILFSFVLIVRVMIFMQMFHVFVDRIEERRTTEREFFCSRLKCSWQFLIYDKTFFILQFCIWVFFLAILYIFWKLSWRKICNEHMRTIWRNLKGTTRTSFMNSTCSIVVLMQLMLGLSSLLLPFLCKKKVHSLKDISFYS
jgi:hypothetical protein